MQPAPAAQPRTSVKGREESGAAQRDKSLLKKERRRQVICRHFLQFSLKINNSSVSGKAENL